jgi:hypothetical protein
MIRPANFTYPADDTTRDHTFCGIVGYKISPAQPMNPEYGMEVEE